jgi:hypothetical protein
VRKYFVFIFYFLFLLIWQDKIVLATSFELQYFINPKKLAFYFPKNHITQIDKINSIKLEKNLRTESWPDRVPFGVGIDKAQNKAFFIYYGSYLEKRIFEIVDSRFKNLEDICVDSKGRIFIADSAENKVFIFQLNQDLKEVNLIDTISIQSPFRLDKDYKETVFILTKENRLAVYLFDENKLIFMPELTKIITKVFTDKKLVLKDISITRYNRINILAVNKLIQFNYKGKIIKEINLSPEFIALDNTIFEDVLLLNSTKKYILKLSSDFEELDKLDIGDLFQEEPLDITVYDSFGYVAVNSWHFGAYYCLGVSVKDLEIRPKLLKNLTKGYDINFKITFPSWVSIDIYSDNGQLIKRLLKEKFLRAKTQHLSWNGKDENEKKCSGKYNIIIKARGKYSLANEDISIFPITLD